MLLGRGAIVRRTDHHDQCRDIFDHIVNINEHHDDTAANNIVVDDHQHDDNDDHDHDHDDAATS